ncbi:MAG: helix-turn-helix transcriptional regulator [Lacibacter sp.]|jgi:putative transcriptional regulator
MKNNLKMYRALRGLTQTEVAEKIGVSRQTIHAIETGKYIPSTLLALKLARLLQVQVEQLFELDANETP